MESLVIRLVQSFCSKVFIDFSRYFCQCGVDFLFEAVCVYLVVSVAAAGQFFNYFFVQVFVAVGSDDDCMDLITGVVDEFNDFVSVSFFAIWTLEVFDVPLFVGDYNDVFFITHFEKIAAVENAGKGTILETEPELSIAVETVVINKVGEIQVCCWLEDPFPV